MKVISIKENPSYFKEGLNYIQSRWASEETMLLYEDCLKHAMTSKQSLPQWYLLLNEDQIIGCAGLITNDFISRMDLYPWLCALYVDEAFRGRAYGSLLIKKIKDDARQFNFSDLYLCTDHVGYYELYDFTYIGVGYHPWGESSRIYRVELTP